MDELHVTVSSNANASAEALRGEGQTVLYMAADRELIGLFGVSDPVKPTSAVAIEDLTREGLHVMMLTGDSRTTAESVARKLGIRDFEAEVLPERKSAAIQRLQQQGRTVAMAGDGINDAPALAAADVGVAMGARGTAAASEAADVVLLVDRLDRLAEGIAVARRTRRIALESVLAGMALSGLGMIAAALGFLPPVAGAVLQEAIDVAVILNALRAVGDGTGRRGAALPAGEVRALQAEHATLAPVLDRLRGLADALGTGDGPQLRAELLAVDALLTGRVLPHERGDEAGLHPRLAALLGGRDPLAAISRTHREIAHLARRLHRLAADLTSDLASEGPAPADVPELRRVLYGLEAILRLHFAQEDELYDSVAVRQEQPGPVFSVPGLLASGEGATRGAEPHVRP
jgi:soluble P-type ATPase